MEKFGNSFALLDDEEEDDLTTLVDRIVKKVDDSLMNAQNDKESSNFVRNDDAQGDYGHRRNYSRDSYRSWGVTEDDGDWQDAVGKTGVNGNESTGVDQTKKENDGWQDVLKSRWKGHANNGGSLEDRQWENYRNKNWSRSWEKRGHGGQFHGVDAADGQKRRYNDGNRGYSGERRGKEDHQVQGNHDGDGQTRYRNGNRGYGGERRGNGDHQAHGNRGGDGQTRYRNGNQGYRNGNRGYGGEGGGYSDQVQDNGAADGHKKYRYGNRGGYGGGKRGYDRDQVLDDGSSSGQQNREGEVFEAYNAGGEERTFRSRNLNYSGDRRVPGGYRGRGRGRLEFQRTVSDEVKEVGNADDGHDANVEHVNGSGRDDATVLDASEAAAAEEEKFSTDKVNGDIRDPKEPKEQKRREDLEKETEEKKWKGEEKEAAVMTLDQYEILLIKRRQELELKLKESSLKTKEGRVAIDKDFVGMRIVERKQEDTDDRWSAIVKPKKKESLKRQASESSKSKDNDVNDSDAKLVEAREIFRSAFRPRSFGGRGGQGDRGGWHGGGGDLGGRSRGRGGDQGSSSRGDQGRFRDRINNDGPRTYSDAPAPRHHRALPPRSEDFPVLAPALVPLL